MHNFCNTNKVITIGNGQYVLNVPWLHFSASSDVYLSPFSSGGWTISLVWSTISIAFFVSQPFHIIGLMAVRCIGAHVGLDSLGPLKKGAFLFLTTGKIQLGQIVLKLAHSENRLAATKAQHFFCDHFGIYTAGGLREVIIGIHHPILFVLCLKLVSGANCLLFNTNFGIHISCKLMSYLFCITPRNELLQCYKICVLFDTVYIIYHSFSCPLNYLTRRAGVMPFLIISAARPAV